MSARQVVAQCDIQAMRPELLLIALSVAFGVAMVFFVVLIEQNSPRLARVHSWPAPVRAALALALCAAVGFTVSIPLAFVGVTGIWVGRLATHPLVSVLAERPRLVAIALTVIVVGANASLW